MRRRRMGRDFIVESLLVMLGGGAGSWVRFVFGRYANPLLSHFPLGTFLANALSCFVLGFFAYWALQRNSPVLRPLILVGFCGGFSTFSTFSHENLRLLESGDWKAFLVYTLGSLSAGLGMLLLGGVAGKWLL